MKILVTGAGGFAGRNIIRYFSEKGHEVTGTYRSKKPELEKYCSLVKCELSEPIEIAGEFDAIIHTACASTGTFEKCKRDNIDSMQQLIKFARENGIKTIINFSTRSVYGKIAKGTKNVLEDHDIINQDYYGITKYAAECLLKDAEDINGLTFRVPGITGEGAHDTWLVSTVNKFIKDELVLVSDFYTKNFVWIMDVAAFAEKMIIESTDGRKFRYNVVNLACKEVTRNTEIVNLIKRRTRSKSEIVIKPSEEGMFALVADKAYEMGYVSHTPIEIVDMYLDTLGFE